MNKIKKALRLAKLQEKQRDELRKLNPFACQYDNCEESINCLMCDFCIDKHCRCYDES